MCCCSTSTRLVSLCAQEFILNRHFGHHRVLESEMYQSNVHRLRFGILVIVRAALGQLQRFVRSSILPAGRSTRATRFAWATPASDNRKLSILGLNSCRGASFWAKLTIQYRTEHT